MTRADHAHHLAEARWYRLQRWPELVHHNLAKAASARRSLAAEGKKL